MRRVVCCFEDRSADTVGLKLLVLSLARYCPELPVVVFGGRLPLSFKGWAASQGNVIFREDIIEAASFWNVKPFYLNLLLGEGYEEVIWLDSDLMVTADIVSFFSGLSLDVLVATEEHCWQKHHGSFRRTVGWGLPVGRQLRRTVNSCVVRVTQSHRSLLDAWAQLLQRADYMQFQQLSWSERPLHMMGDQDVLTALLGSEDYAGMPVKLLKRGRDIAQCFQEDGYSVSERLLSLVMSRPKLLHAQGEKPWRPRSSPVAYQEVSPVRYEALTYVDGLADEERDWLHIRSRSALIADAVFLKSPDLAGLPFAIRKTGDRYLRRFPKAVSLIGKRVSSSLHKWRSRFKQGGL